MDQAPAALSAIFTNVFEEVRDELNELKQSYTSVLKTVETHEAYIGEMKQQSEATQTAQEHSQSQLETQQAQIVHLTTSLEEAREENRTMKEDHDKLWKSYG